MNDLTNTNLTEANPFAAILQNPQDGALIGFELTGAQAGPTILVAGISPLLEAVFDRLSALPTLPWMRGKIRMHILHHGEAETDLAENIIDEVLYLPGLVVPDLSEEAIKDGYLSVLRLAARMGMISGRGVTGR